MPGNPQFSYFLLSSNHPVTKESTPWESPLPLRRHLFLKKETADKDLSVSHGSYFLAIRTFLEQNGFEIITSAVYQRFNRNIKPDDIEEIRICLEKHGEFYHPSRIETVVSGAAIPFVVNVAVSHSGKKLIRREYQFLQRLNRNFPNSFIPKVYAQGDVSTTGNQPRLRMFLGEWFDGFNEFHISRDKADEKRKLAVWDPAHGNFFLPPDLAATLYTQAAMILTYYYNIETFEQISLWHHAAGDFVIKLEEGKIAVKLITVRQYAPLFEPGDIEDEGPDVERVLEAMLIFLLNLTIRMRLDRQDGTGEMVWSDNVAVEGALKGFFRGLALQAKSGRCPEVFVDYFRSYLLLCTENDLLDLSRAIADKYSPRAPEFPVVKENLKPHVKVLYTIIKKENS